MKNSYTKSLNKLLILAKLTTSNQIFHTEYYLKITFSVSRQTLQQTSEQDRVEPIAESLIRRHLVPHSNVMFVSLILTLVKIMLASQVPKNMSYKIYLKILIRYFESSGVPVTQKRLLQLH